MAGRPREFDRDAALEAAMLVFWRKGFMASSMKDLCDAMHIGSPSLYAAFTSKEALFHEALGHYAATISPVVWDGLTGHRSARAAVEALLMAAAQALPEANALPAGCMIMLGAAADKSPATISDAVKALRVESLAQLHARLEAARESGELPPSTNIHRLSQFYFAAIQGMALQARDGATPADLEALAALAMAAWPKRSKAAH